ncbi:MAG: ATP-binding protein [Flavobacteriales bacterium]|nr:ATP-binding protein [Flavobacteriales bacterium]
MCPGPDPRAVQRTLDRAGAQRDDLGSGRNWQELSACALAGSACRRGVKTAYWRVSVFLDTLAADRALGTYHKTLEKLRKSRLVLDDLGADVLIEISDGSSLT